MVARRGPAHRCPQPAPPRGEVLRGARPRICLGRSVLASRFRCCLAVAALVVAVRAQGPRLVDCVESPLAYVALGASPSQPSPSQPGPTAGDTIRASAVQRLLADPVFDALFAGGAESRGAEGDSVARALALVRGVLARSSGDLEIALTGVVPTVGQPLLVLRARLQPDEVARLQRLLDGPVAGDPAAGDPAAGEAPRTAPLAVPHRRLGGHATYMLCGEDAASRGRLPNTDDLPPGGLVELALVGCDLLVANDGTAMHELLAPARVGTSAAPGPRVLANDAAFVALRRRLELPTGSLLVYGDWQRLGARLHTANGVAGSLFGWSGLGAARRVMASFAVADEAPAAGRPAPFVGTLLFDFDAPDDVQAPRPGGPGGRGRPGERYGPGRGPGHEPAGVDGWLDAVQPVAARTLLADLPGGGLGGLVVSLDLAASASRSRGGARMLRELQHAFAEFGLDFERNVLGRLAARGTVHLHFADAAAGAEVTMACSLRARSRQAAADLVTDLRRAAEPRGLGRVTTGKGRIPEVVELRRHAAATPVFVAVADDLVLVGLDADLLVRAHDDLRRSARSRSRRDAAVQSAVQALGGEDVVGVFDLDLQDIFTRLLPGAPGLASRLPARHIGCLDVQPREGGVVLRVRVSASS
jgi:hypothetical protein